MQHADLGEDIKVVELGRIFVVVVAEGITRGCLGDELPARVLVEDVEPENRSAEVDAWSETVYSRQAAMRRDVFQQCEANVGQPLRRLRLGALVLKILHRSIISTQNLGPVSKSGEGSHLNIEIVIDLDHLPEHKDVLHQAGKLPHIAQFCQRLGVFGVDGGLGGQVEVQLGLIASAFVARHRWSTLSRVGRDGWEEVELA